MLKWTVRYVFLLIVLAALPVKTPAPFVYRAGEGWTYEPVGGTKWTRGRAKDQLEVAEKAFEKKDYSLALKAGRRVVRTWPLSDYAPRAQYIAGRCYEEKGMDERAFKEYQKLVEKYPKSENYDEVLKRQFDIANRYLAGQWFKLWGYIPFFSDMNRTCEMYEKVIKNGPYSEVAPQAQMNIGKAREKMLVPDFPAAVKAYEKAADRYHDQTKVAADAMFQAGQAYHRQTKTAEYDQSVASQAIGTFTDFIALYPQDSRVAEAREIIAALKTEQSRGSFQIAEFYEKKKRYDAALVYYNEAVLKDPDSKYAQEAKQRIDSIKKRTGGAKQTAQN